MRPKAAELAAKSYNLEETNTALRVLLKRREEDKGELEEKVLTNVKELVIPYLEKLKKTSLDGHQISCISILESNLNDIISPFSRKIRVDYFVKAFKTNKEISEFMNVSAKTIETHRDNLRKKMGIKHKKTNLRTYLSSVQ